MASWNEHPEAQDEALLSEDRLSTPERPRSLSRRVAAVVAGVAAVGLLCLAAISTNSPGAASGVQSDRQGHVLHNAAEMLANSASFQMKAIEVPKKEGEDSSSNQVFSFPRELIEPSGDAAAPRELIQPIGDAATPRELIQPIGDAAAKPTPPSQARVELLETHRQILSLEAKLEKRRELEKTQLASLRSLQQEVTIGEDKLKQRREIEKAPNTTLRTLQRKAVNLSAVAVKGKENVSADTAPGKRKSNATDASPKSVHKQTFFNDSRHAGCQRRPQPSDDKGESSPAAESKGTVKLWGQCDGSGYKGETECKIGLRCEAKPIKGLKDYKQCKPDPDFSACQDGNNPDMACFYKVQWDMQTGIVQRPDMYHGLTAESSFAEFQEQNFNFLPEKSKCPAPCAPGTCFEVLANEGCDSFNEWACEGDDRSLAFDCCCKKFHPDVTKKWSVVKEHNEKQKPVKPSIFCIALVLPRSYEVELMRAQFERGLGIFDAGCDAWATFSNESISMNCHNASKKFDSVVMNGTLEVERGGDFDSALNTGVFERFWDRVLEDGRVWDYDWVVKVDPDTLFFPDRLKDIINSGVGPFGEKEPSGGMYINNCFLGMHGPIEVFSKKALGNFKGRKQKCDSGEPGEKGQEDVYLRECFELLGVEKVEAFNILLESENACKEKPSTQEPHSRPPCFAPEAAFHPFKGIQSMMRCWAEAVSHDVSSQMAPVSDAPSSANGRHG